MPVLRDALAAEGALVEVLVGLSATSVQLLRAALRPIPPPITARALIDTGAEVSCIDAGLAQAAGLGSGGMTLANVPGQGGLIFGLQHDISLTVLHPSGRASDYLVLGNLTAVELRLGALGYEALIGRDVLARCRFRYDGPGNRFRLSY